MIQLCEVDEAGFFVSDVFLDTVPIILETVKVDSVDAEGNPIKVDLEKPKLDHYGNTIPNPRFITQAVPPGFYHPKWDGEKWVEGMSQNQIDELKNQPVQLTPEQEEMKILKRRLDEAENTVVFLLDMNLMGGM